MSSTTLSVSGEALRRTQSTGDIRRSVERPLPLRIPLSSRDHGSVLYNSTVVPGALDSPRPAPGLDSSPTINTDDDANARLAAAIAELRRQRSLERRRSQPWLQRVTAFFGYGRRNRARKELVNLIWTLSFGVVQFIIIVTFLVISHNTPSKTNPNDNEWTACSRPLGIWDSIWLLRLLLASVVSTWNWRRERARRLFNSRNDASDPEAGRTSDRPGPVPSIPSARSPSRGASSSGRRSGQNTSSDQAGQPTSGGQPPLSIFFSRLSILSSLLTIVWYMVAHVYIYTTFDTCKKSSPHLWWLTFSIMCLLYVMVLEVVIFGIMYLVVYPLIVLFWNIVLICLGRHPIQNPAYIKPEISKLPKSVVDRIPLVLYIPTPDDDAAAAAITVPPAVYAYPPKPARQQSLPKRRFAFLRGRSRARKSSGDDADAIGNAMDGKNDSENTDEKDKPWTWEDNWEAGEHPFVRLEGNRAVCAICLMDFEEPKRAEKGTQKQVPVELAVAPAAQHPEGVDGEGESAVQEILVEDIDDEEQQRQLRLADAGEGAQPLRLLGCGHVFHKTCLDPWLIDVSGRCPVCQRPVELEEPEKKRRRRGRRVQEDSQTG